MMANSSGPCAQLATSVVTWLHREPEITGGGWPGVGYSDPSPRPRKSRCSDHSIVPGVLGWLPKLTSGSPGRRRKRRKSCLSSGGRAIAKASSETPDESRKTIVTMSINNVFVRNARGLNDRARRNVVWEFLIQERRPPWPVSKRQVADLNVTLMNEVAGAELLISTIAVCLPSGYQDSGGVATGLEARPVVWNTVVRSTIFCDTVLAAINR